MGKSTAADMFRRMGVPVFDSDASVHHLTGPHGAALHAIEARFPGIAGDEGVDRKKLGAIVFENEDALADLEAILHPRVQAQRKRFLVTCALRRISCVVLDIPLLFETGVDGQCDDIVVVSTASLVQRQRAMRRPGMTEEKFAGILNRQMPDYEKRKRATVVVPTGLGCRETWRILKKTLNTYRDLSGRR